MGVMTDNERLRKVLCTDDLDLGISDDYARVFNQLDAFVAQSQSNDTIRCVNLFPYDDEPGNYELWDKVGQGVESQVSRCAQDLSQQHLWRTRLGGIGSYFAAFTKQD
jgi:hypothetical protein